jgi:hypothetical protein
LDHNSAWEDLLGNKASRLPTKKYPFEECFKEAAEIYNLPFALLIAVARGESDFDPNARSLKSCYGIMQIQWPGTAKDLGFKNIQELYDPCKNIKAGARYLRMMLNRYDGKIELALAAYNYGPGRISTESDLSSLPQGAKRYTARIHHHLEQVLSRKGDDNNPRYQPGMKMPIIVFHDPTRAKNFISYFNKLCPELRLDWFRTSLGETHIVLLFDTEKEKKWGLNRMKQLGYGVL